MRRYGRRTVLAALATALAASGCNVPGLGLAQDAGRYVNEMRAPLASMADWVGKVRQLYADIPGGDPIAIACGNGRITALIDEGNGVVTGFMAVKSPTVIASTHQGVIDRAQQLVDKLTETRTLLCERQDVAGARAAIDDIGNILNDVSTWLGRLSSWVREQ